MKNSSPASAGYPFTDPAELSRMLRPRQRDDHKGCFGHGLLVAGCRDMCGGAILAASGALRSGIGLLDVHTPQDAYLCLQTAVPEAMVRRDTVSTACFAQTGLDLSRYNAVAVGPALGQGPQQAAAIDSLLQGLGGRALVLDADALNLLAAYRLFHRLPAEAILTPHPKEFQRLHEAWRGPRPEKFDRSRQIEAARDFAREFGVFLLLKGAGTAIVSPDGEVVLNPSGNPGMATGGSGDVLCGILLSLLAQSYTPRQAAQLGCYLHGRSGDLALSEGGESCESLVAGDLPRFLGQAFLELKHASE